jgi:hypothetical protein
MGQDMTHLIWVVRRAHLPHLTAMEAADLVRSAVSRTQRSKAPSGLSAVQGMVVDVVEAVVIREFEDIFLQTLA